jgi:hypothetical protein
MVLITALLSGLASLREWKKMGQGENPNALVDGNRGNRGNRGDTDRPNFAPANPQFTNPAPFPPPPPPKNEPKVLTPGVRETTPEGGAFATNNYREVPAERSILIGFDVGVGKIFGNEGADYVAYLRPIWLNAKGEFYGTAYGKATGGPIVIVKARDGYSVGGIRISGGGGLAGICFTFMRCGSKHLFVNDAYVSDWYGDKAHYPGPDQLRRGEGEYIIGIFGKRFNDRGGINYDNCGGICSIGLVQWVKE